MKKIITLIIVAMALQINAQQFVSTEVQNRNVFLEEYTGRQCTWCPDGQLVANGIAKTNPGRVFLVNIHAGSFSPGTYPNLNTDDGTTMVEANQLYSFPAGYVNRTSEYAIGREQWSSYAMEQLSQTAECNVDGQVVINPQTREALINVEVYYTSNSAKDKNYLTVMMLQDDIVGDQDGAPYNPEQYINGEYHHMHVLRDVITPTWGEEISPTTAGTLITKTYNITIPEVIGNPNGADAVLENINFVAFVSESYSGIQSCPILNVNELPTIMDTEESILPKMTAVYPSSYTSCTENNILKINVLNSGKQDITSMKFEVVANGESSEFSWNGNLPSCHETIVEFDMTNAVGENTITASIIEVNSNDYEFSKTIEVNIDEWIEVATESEEETFTIEVAQDKYGHQTRWYVLTSDYTILASGGPYEMLSEPGTELHQETLTLSKGDCVKFIITDAGGNGINNSNGEGYYRILDSKGEAIVESDGKFEIEESHLIYIFDGVHNITAHICEGESYTEYGFDITDAEVGTHEYENVYNGITYILTLTVDENPTVTIDGETSISEGESVELMAAGADSYLWSTGETAATIVVTPNETTTYSVVGFKNGCEATAEITVNVTIGIDENTMNEVKVYPNPTENELNVECIGMQEIIVFMPNGQLVEKIKVDTDKYLINLNEYNMGIYFLKIISKDGISVEKIMRN